MYRSIFGLSLFVFVSWLDERVYIQISVWKVKMNKLTMYMYIEQYTMRNMSPT